MPPAGVGARHGSMPVPPGGGGYLPRCSVFEFRPAGEKKRDPRLDELEAMGIQLVHRQVAEEIGFDAFVAAWRIWDAHLEHGENMLNVSIRPYRSYLKFQRNRYIESLFGMGMKPCEIRAAVKNNLGEKISNYAIFSKAIKKK